MAKVEVCDTVTQGGSQLLVQNLDEGLSGRETAQYFRSDSTLTHARHKVPDHRQGDIRLDQRAPHIADGILDIFFGQSPTTTHLIENTA
jgi:hypothetical protein